MLVLWSALTGIHKGCQPHSGERSIWSLLWRGARKINYTTTTKKKKRAPLIATGLKSWCCSAFQPKCCTGSGTMKIQSQVRFLVLGLSETHCPGSKVLGLRHMAPQEGLHRLYNVLRGQGGKLYNQILLQFSQDPSRGTSWVPKHIFDPDGAKRSNKASSFLPLQFTLQ